MADSLILQKNLYRRYFTLTIADKIIRQQPAENRKRYIIQ